MLIWLSYGDIIPPNIIIWPFIVVEQEPYDPVSYANENASSSVTSPKYGDIFLHQNFYFFYTKKFAFFTPKNLLFLHQKICFFYIKKFAFFTAIFFYTKIFGFLHQFFLHQKICFFTLKFLVFLHQNLCFFYTNNLAFF